MTPNTSMSAGKAALAGASVEDAARAYWLAAQVARWANSAPTKAILGIQTLATLAATRTDRVGRLADGRFATIVGRAISIRLGDTGDDLPPAA